MHPTALNRPRQVGEEAADANSEQKATSEARPRRACEAPHVFGRRVKAASQHYLERSIFRKALRYASVPLRPRQWISCRLSEIPEISDVRRERRK